ncbi:MAG: hypothetical protein V4739_07280 [Pseudomonadota bacterium]
MHSARIVEQERLDALPPGDPAAQRSRADLRRLHLAMGTRSILSRALRAVRSPPTGQGSLRVLELGAGDGSLMVGVARSLAPTWPPVNLTLLDRQALVLPSTVAQYAASGWVVSTHTMDVFEWVHDVDESKRRWDLIVANLFLHHFEAAPLAELLDAIAARTDFFFACEPSRHRLALAGSHLVGLLGANAVTREDAVLSVRAGFRGDELSQLWPRPPEGSQNAWRLKERPAGLFNHCFQAERTTGEP